MTYFDEAHAHDADLAVSLMAHDQYFRELCWMPTLSREEEARLVALLQQGRASAASSVDVQVAREARSRLVEAYQRVIASIAASFARSSASNDRLDFINEGVIGLLHFLDRLDTYEALTGAAFHTLALAYIRGAMYDLSYHRDGMVRVPAEVVGQLKRLAQAEERFCDTQEREPMPCELAAALHLSVEKVLELGSYQQYRFLASFEGHLEKEGEEACDGVRLLYASLDGGMEGTTAVIEVLYEAIHTVLTEQQRKVLYTRYGFDEGPSAVRSWREVAKMLGLSKTCVMEHNRCALGRLIGRLEQSGLSSQEVA
jgi:RNA polymerase primary sigma factor